MSAAWNIPFALLFAVSLWVRVRPAERALACAGPVLAFFGIGGVDLRTAASDALAIAGAAGLLFVAWSDRLAAPAVWLAVDAVAIAIGAGLAGSWLLARFAVQDDDPADPSGSEM